MSAFERVVTAFEGAGLAVDRKGDNRASAQGPGHSSADRSVSITGIEGQVLMHSFAGEDTADILAGVGLRMRDLFDDPKGSTYTYPGGRIVQRAPGKRFWQAGNKQDRSLYRADRIGMADTVFACEGEKDCLAIEALGGVAVCSAMGAGKAGRFDWAPLAGKRVIIVADRDEPGRKHAQQVAELVRPIATSVQIVEAAAGKDAADHIAAGNALDQFVTDEEAPPGEEAPPSGRPLYPPPSAPLDVARQLFARWRTDDGLLTLRAWRGGWMRWTGPHWADVDQAELRSDIYATLGEADHMAGSPPERVPWNPNRRKVVDVLDAMAAAGHLPSEVDPPAWIGTSTNGSASQVIACANGLLDLSTRTISELTPALFNLVSVPFDYDPQAGEPAEWLKFLASVWPDDPDSVALLQEFIGYILSGRTDMQKMLLLVGPTRSGKGTIARMITQLIGRGHVAGPTLASLGTNFGLSPLLGRPLAIVSDARLGNAPANTIVERLLSITGEDMLTVDRKYKEPWSGKLPTRFVMLSNELPRFRDASGAIANRLVIAQMIASFLGREDRDLDRRLRAELPAILLWALDGLDRLTRNGRFTVPGSSADAVTLMADLASPTSAFVRDRCTLGADDEVLADDLYGAWKAWAEDNGHHAGAKSSFGRDLRAVVPGVKVGQPTVDGARVRQYLGIGLRGGADDPACALCGKPVIAGQRDDSGQPAHRGCQPVIRPAGPGRCPECGFHVPTQGHRNPCLAARTG